PARGGRLVALGAGAAWLGIPSIPASRARREPIASAPAPARSAPSVPPSASGDTFEPPAPDPAPPSSPTPAPVRTTRPAVTTRAPVVKRPAPPPPPPPARVAQPNRDAGPLSV